MQAVAAAVACEDTGRVLEGLACNAARGDRAGRPVPAGTITRAPLGQPSAEPASALSTS